MKIFNYSRVFSKKPPIFAINLMFISFFSVSGETPHTKIQHQVENFLQQQLADGDVNTTIVVNDIDSRINIPQCQAPLAMDVDADSLSQSYVTVKVSCPDTQWYLYTTAKVARTQTIVVTSSPISPGTVLGTDNLTLAEVDVNSIRHTPYTDIQVLLGARLKYRVRPGQAVQSNMLCFICKGDRITISAVAGGMQVKTSGVAKQDGILGDTIRVENTNSHKQVIAEVASTREVVLNL